MSARIVLIVTMPTGSTSARDDVSGAPARLMRGVEFCVVRPRPRRIGSLPFNLLAKRVDDHVVNLGKHILSKSVSSRFGLPQGDFKEFNFNIVISACPESFFA